MPIFGQIRMKTANFTPDLGLYAADRAAYDRAVVFLCRPHRDDVAAGADQRSIRDLAGLGHNTRQNGLIAGGYRRGEVLAGWVVGLVVVWILSIVWPLPRHTDG